MKIKLDTIFTFILFTIIGTIVITFLMWIIGKEISIIMSAMYAIMVFSILQVRKAWVEKKERQRVNQTFRRR